LSDLDDPKSGYPGLSNELRKLPDFHQDTAESKLAVQRIATLALQSDEPQVKDAFRIMLLGGTPDSNDFRYFRAPNWNTELQALYWLAEQTGFKKNDSLALAIAMAHGVFISLASDDDLGKAVYHDISSFLNFLRSINDYQASSKLTPLENYPLEAKLALAWRANDWGRFGRVFYTLGDNACPGSNYETSTPANIHNFHEYSTRPMNVKDYKFNTVSVSTLTEMSKYVIDRGWEPNLGAGTRRVIFSVNTVRDFAHNQWVYAHDYPGYKAPCENWVTIDGERSRPTNINNPNYVWRIFKSTGEGYGVSDDSNAFTDALVKSMGIPGISLDYVWGPIESSSHEETLYYDPSSNAWYASSFGTGETPLASTSMDIFIFRPPAVWTNFFIFTEYDRWTHVPNLYHRILKVNGAEFSDILNQGIPSSEIYQWFFSLS
jgi:hypothetical protein